MDNCYYALFAVEFSHAAGISTPCDGYSLSDGRMLRSAPDGGPSGASGSAANARVSGKPSRPLMQPLLNVSRGMEPGTCHPTERNGDNQLIAAKRAARDGKAAIGRMTAPGCGCRESIPQDND
jgi:hypothetical protein